MQETKRRGLQNEELVKGDTVVLELNNEKEERFRKKAKKVIKEELDFKYLDNDNLLEVLAIIFRKGDEGILELAQDMSDELGLSLISTTHWLYRTRDFVTMWAKKKRVLDDTKTSFKSLVDYIDK